ncbi:MAG: HAD family hydrolase [Candidatus Omnitrophica bacterium]|nr:HAD family hydrolase [Candidatus Omnitrophota bacterium]
MVRAILFDLDDTLIVEEKATEEALFCAATLVYQSYKVSPHLFIQTIKQISESLWLNSPQVAWCQAIGVSAREALWADLKEEIPEEKKLRDWILLYRQMSWKESLSAFRVKDACLAEEMSACYIKECQRRHQVFPETFSVLKSLQGFRLGLLTNGFAGHQRSKLVRAGLANFFPLVIVSAEFGQGKPHPGIFLKALSSLGVAAGETWMVGNCLINDISGAQSVGIKTIWVNRSGQSLPTKIFPDVIVSNLQQIGEVFSAGKKINPSSKTLGI